MEELWFVFDGYEGVLNTFSSRIMAENEFDETVLYYETEARRTGDWETPVDVYFGKVYRRAEIVDVEPPIDDIDGQTEEYATMLVTNLVEEL